MDVIILGGGVVGLAMALLLARETELQIVLLEPNQPNFDWNNETYDIRCSAISPGVQNIFAHLDIWPNIIMERIGVYDRMIVWDQELHQRIEFNANSMGMNHLGHIVENRILTKHLYQQLQQYDTVQIIHAQAENLDVTPEQVALTVNGNKIVAKLLIGADGGNSWVRKQAQIPSYGWEYKHTALVATIRCEYPHANIAQQRFMSDGPLAFLPLADDHLCSIVWSSDPAQIEDLMELNPQEFCMRLAQEFSFKLGKLSLEGPRACFPLRMQHAANYVMPRIALIGDAAHVVHPLAGQGLNLGILDAAVLAEVLQAAYAKGIDVGQLVVLRKYELRRKGHNLSMITLLETLKRTFAIKNRAISTVRAYSLQLLNNLDFVKNNMMRYAMGISGDMPMTAKLQR